MTSDDHITIHNIADSLAGIDKRLSMMNSMIEPKHRDETRQLSNLINSVDNLYIEMQTANWLKSVEIAQRMGLAENMPASRIWLFDIIRTGPGDRPEDTIQTKEDRQ